MSDLAPHSREKPLYELERGPEPPRLTGAVVMRRDADGVHEALGADLLLHAWDCVRTFGNFHLALSGGSTPMPFYRRLMTDPMFRDLPWKRTHLWVVDERRVPPDDERCNWAQIADYLLDHSDIPASQAHPMEQMNERADERYESLLRETLGWREKGHDRLDFVLLGMGSDGHTASLFPRSPALRESRRLVVINRGPTVAPPERITMTYPILNSARFVAVLVMGSAKREAVRRVASAVRTAESVGPDELPILGIRPIGDGVVRWYIDEEACPEHPARHGESPLAK